MSTTTTHIEKKKMLAPKLRFKDFGEPWLNKLYGDIYSFYTTNSFSRDNLNYESGVVKNIHYGDIHTKFTTLFDIKKEQVPFVNTEINLSKINQDSFCKERDLVVADASEDYADIGKTIELVNLNNEKVIAGLHTFLVRPNKHEMAKGFAGYLVQSWKFRKQVMIIAQGTKVLSLSTGRLANLKLNIPTLPEQQKIASFLSAIDEKIQQLTRKKELLEQYKKGVMQRLFLSESMSELGFIGFKDDRIPEDETNPKILSSKKSKFRPLRFKPDFAKATSGSDENGKAYPRWEEKRLGEVCTFFSGGTPASTNKKFYSGTIPFIGSGNIYDSEVFSFISDEALNSSSAKMVGKGDLLYALYGANSGEVAISKINGAINQAILCIRSEECIEYLYYILLLDKDKIVAKYLQGGQGNLSANIIKKLKFKLPSIDEQQKIASYLSSLDTKIETVATQIAQSQTFKKGLLQEMFV